MDDERTSQNASKSQGAGGQASAASPSSPLMRGKWHSCLATSLGSAGGSEGQGLATVAAAPCVLLPGQVHSRSHKTPSCLCTSKGILKSCFCSILKFWLFFLCIIEECLILYCSVCKQKQMQHLDCSTLKNKLQCGMFDLN